MAKLILLCVLAVFSFAFTSDAANYVVGDTSGWDISTDIDSWESGKIFKVGDVLLFQYSSYNSLCEVRKENFESCNTTDPLTQFSNGNTTVTLSRPGARYFVCCNQMRCLGGMKLQVDIPNDQATKATVAAPKAQPGATLPQPSSKSNNPSTVIPTSSGFVVGGSGSFVTFLMLIAMMLILLKI